MKCFGRGHLGVSDKSWEVEHEPLLPILIGQDKEVTVHLHAVIKKPPTAECNLEIPEWQRSPHHSTHLIRFGLVYVNHTQKAR